jgi:hypothetical protein
MAASQRSPSLSDMLFPDAADLWLRSCAGISENTRYSRACNINRLSKCFGEMKLAEIELSHIRDYQAQRVAGTIPGLRKAGPSAINRELSTLKQILDRAGEWNRLKKRYEPLRIVPQRFGPAHSDEEETRLFAVAYQDTELARKLAACVVSHVSGAESIDGFLLYNVPEEVPQVWHELAEQVMRALFLGKIAISGHVSKLIQ